MQRIIIATGHGAPGLFHDEQGLPAAFAEHGLDARVADWKDITPDGTPILVRTAWDYTQHPVQFMAWLDAIEQTGTTCINSPSTMRWNMDKRYLLELEARGHAIVPTVAMHEYTAAGALAIAAEQGWSDAVAKPVLGGGAEGLVRLRDGAATPFDLAGNSWAQDAPVEPRGPCLVQPFMPAIHDGEWSLFFFGGTLSHAIRKVPADGDIRVQEEHGGTSASAQPPPAVVDAASRIVADVDAIVCRVDGLEVDGEFLVMELELIEPELYFRYTTGGESRLADAVAAAL